MTKKTIFGKKKIKKGLKIQFLDKKDERNTKNDAKRHF